MVGFDTNLSFLNPAPIGRLAVHLQGLVRTQLWAQIIVALILGLGVGLALGPDIGWVPASIANPMAAWLAFPGHLFLALVQMVMVPLIVASVICGIAAGEDATQLRRLGLRLAVYVVGSTMAAAAVGIGLAYLLKPGSRVASAPVAEALPGPEASAAASGAISVEPGDILGLLPENPLASMASGEMLPIILFSLIFGIGTLGIQGELASQIIGLLEAVQAVCMRIIGWAMRLAPVAVFGLMSNVGVGMGIGALAGMAFYLLVATLGFALVVLLYLLVVAVMGRRTPSDFWGRYGKFCCSPSRPRAPPR